MNRKQVNDVNTPLHLLEPEYDIPYVIPTKETVAAALKKVLDFLEQATPAGFVNSVSGRSLQSNDGFDENTVFAKSDFRITSYEWGVTYVAMILAGEVTGDESFSRYSASRLAMIADLSKFFLDNKLRVPEKSPVYSVLNPHALDDCGALCAAMIKSQKAGLDIGLRPLIDHFITYISEKEFRLGDGTLARNRPYPNTLWLDDLFMSVPALGQMASLTGEGTYYDDAVKQVLQFSERMFISEKGLYMHGWVQEMSVHLPFCWARANGWAVMAMVELLDVLPQNHPGYNAVLEQFQKHIRGLAQYQAQTGFWHQLLDRNDSYPETSATAIITYAMARGINMGLIDKLAYAPVAVLGWNAAASKINEAGQIEGSCVGTGMGFDAAFYCYRPVNIYAAHGYGPVLLAASEIINLLATQSFRMIENSLQIKK